MEPLVTVEAFGRYLQRPYATEDAQWALDMASGQVRDHCGWSISAESVTFVLDGSTTPLLNLPTLRLNAVHEVRVAGSVISPALSFWAPGADEYTWSRKGQIYRPNGWPDAFGSVEVDVAHGYAADEIPATIAMVVCGIAEAVLPNAARNLVSKTVGAVTHTYRDTASTLSVVQAFQLAGYTL